MRDAARVSSSQIYHYFADKDDLTRAVIAFQTEVILANQTPLLARLDSLEALQAWRDVVVDAARGAGRRRRVLRSAVCPANCPTTTHRRVTPWPRASARGPRRSAKACSACAPTALCALRSTPAGSPSHSWPPSSPSLGQGLTQSGSGEFGRLGHRFAAGRPEGQIR
jgi:AcrR family transcriptional regulator